MVGQSFEYPSSASQKKSICSLLFISVTAINTDFQIRNPAEIILQGGRDRARSLISSRVSGI